MILQELSFKTNVYETYFGIVTF